MELHPRPRLCLLQARVRQAAVAQAQATAVAASVQARQHATSSAHAAARTHRQACARGSPAFHDTSMCSRQAASQRRGPAASVAAAATIGGRQRRQAAGTQVRRQAGGSLGDLHYSNFLPSTLNCHSGATLPSVRAMPIKIISISKANSTAANAFADEWLTKLK